MNTGGFFVALLKKVAPLNARARKRFEEFQEELQNDIKEDKEAKKSRSRKDDEPKAKKAKIEEDAEASQNADIEEGSVVDEGKMEGGVDSDIDTGDPKTKQPVHGYLKRRFLEEDGEKSKTVGKDDYIPVPSDIFQPLKEYYGLDEESFKEGQFMVRAGGDRKTLFFVTKTVKKLIDMGLQERVTVVNTGLKAFQRNNKECEVSYRVSQEAINYVAPHMSKRKISVDIMDFEKCLTAPTVQIQDFSEEFAAKIRELSTGCLVVQLKGYEHDYPKKMMIVLWRNRGDSVNYLVTQNEIDGLKSKMRAITNMGSS
jgi:hypothetical protein